MVKMPFVGVLIYCIFYPLIGIYSVLILGIIYLIRNNIYYYVYYIIYDILSIIKYYYIYILVYYIFL